MEQLVKVLLSQDLLIGASMLLTAFLLLKWFSTREKARDEVLAKTMDMHERVTQKLSKSIDDMGEKITAKLDQIGERL